MENPSAKSFASDASPIIKRGGVAIMNKALPPIDLNNIRNKEVSSKFKILIANDEQMQLYILKVIF